MPTAYPREAINKRVVESLIKAGAFDFSGYNRAQLLSVYERVLDDAAKKHKNNLSGQVCLFDMMSPQDCVSGVAVPDMPEHSRNALLNMEKEITGVYITGHPLDQVAGLLRARASPRPRTCFPWRKTKTTALITTAKP